MDEQEKADLGGKMAQILDSASGGISQRPTAWTACIIVIAFCCLAGWVAWVVPWPTVIAAMCSGGGG